MTWIRNLWLAAVVAGALAFADTPFRSWRQRFVDQRTRARLVLLSLELDLVALWAIAKFWLRRDLALAPGPAAPAVAGLGLALAVAGLVLIVWAQLRLGRWFSPT